MNGSFLTNRTAGSLFLVSHHSWKMNRLSFCCFVSKTIFMTTQKTLPLPLPSQSAECLTTSVPAVITSDNMERSFTMTKSWLTNLLLCCCKPLSFGCIVWWNDKKGHLKRMENKGCCSNYFLLNNSFSRDKLLVIKWGIERYARSSVVIIKLLI